MGEINPVRDPVTGQLYPGARLPGGGNPLAKEHYKYRRAFIDAATPEEFAKARANVVERMLEGSDAATKVYFEFMCGKSALPVEISRGDDDRAGAAADATLARVLAVLERHPAIRSEVADVLLDAMPATEVLNRGRHQWTERLSGPCGLTRPRSWP